MRIFCVFPIFAAISVLGREVWMPDGEELTPFNCQFPCFNTSLSHQVYGTSVYFSGSSICKSALHDLRIPKSKDQAKGVIIKSYKIDNCFLKGSTRFGFSSYDFKNEFCSVFEFVNSRFSEPMLDVVSLHSNYLFGKNENHTQYCVVASKALHPTVNFDIYSEWTNSHENESSSIFYKNSVQHSKIWSESTTSGFQCIPLDTTLSIITSIAFRKDAHFMPKNFTVTVNKNEDVTLAMDKIEYNDLEYEIEWRKDGKMFERSVGVGRTQLLLSNVQESSSGIYTLGYANSSDSERFGSMQLIVRSCPEEKYGPNCTISCSTCLNGGICHDITGECVCPPGFNGSRCEKACKAGYLGKTCSIQCPAQENTTKNLCKGLLICLPRPYGCSCASGFTGLYCNKVCEDGFYGAGCKQLLKYSHPDLKTCSKFSGFCECQSGWHGTYCNESYPVLRNAPNVLNITKNSMTVLFPEWSNSTDIGSGTPKLYEIVYKEYRERNWLHSFILDPSENRNCVANIQHLKPDTMYLIGVVIHDVTENKQEAIKIRNVTTPCDVPSAPPSDIELRASNQNVYITWKIPPKMNWNCWGVDTVIKQRESSTNVTQEYRTNASFYSFISKPHITWIIELCVCPVDGLNEEVNCSEPRNITSNGPLKLESSSISLTAILGILLPFVLAIIIIVLMLHIQKRRKLVSSLKVKFLPFKVENEFGSCNEALDEMDIIETESMCEDISNRIYVEDLPKYIKQNVQTNKIRKEFLSIPNGQIYPCSVAKLGENKPKNRYGNILPYDHSRVVLDTVNGDAFSNYIHASYVHGYEKLKKYIATQGPLVSTTWDFWRMVWNEGSCKILMITNFVENGKPKCEKYWSEDTTKYGDITVSFENSKSYADFIIRTFKISKGKSSRELKQFHYITWPDHGAPSNPTPFVSYLNKARNYKCNYDAPIIVHCSAGIGRTGTTILLDSMMDMGMHEKYVDLVRHLCCMRKQRMNILENLDQYMFVHYALVESLCFEETCVKCPDFTAEFERLHKVDNATGKTYLEKQFQAINNVATEWMYKDMQEAYLMVNQSKNRSMLILPPDRARPFLSSDSSNSGYINAVYVDSFTEKDAFVATQYPLPDTVQDFWNMVYGLKSKTIVILQDMDISDKDTPELWIPEGLQTSGPFQIECQSLAENHHFKVVHLSVSGNRGEPQDTLLIHVVVLKNWALDSNLPLELDIILSAIDKVHLLQTESKHVVTVVCSDGVTACGIFCTALYIYNQIITEKEVDVARAVKCVKANRPQFILNMEQYKFLYDLVLLI